MPGALTRNVVKRVRSTSERSDGSDKKVSFNKSVHVKKIPSHDSGLNTRQSITVLEAESDPFWFNVYRDYNDFSDDVFTDRTSPGNVTSAPRTRDVHLEGSPSAGKEGSSAMYGHVNLHPSQQIGTPPKIKRNLVRNIVAQFNEEAKRREKLRREFDETDAEALSPTYTRPISPIFFESNADAGPNNNVPFSYTSTLPPSFMNKSRSEYDLKTPDDEIIYAQVVVNGHAQNGMANKTTVHTKVPNKSFSKEDRSRSMNRNQSISMTNLPSKTYIKPHKNNYMNGGIADYEPQRTMTQKKFADEYERQESTRQIRNRSVSPELLISRDEERKKEHNNLKYLNGNAGLGHSENRKQTNYSEEYSTSTLHREKRKDKSKREKSPSHKEHKEKRNTSAERREEKRDKRLQGISREKHSTPREPSPDYKFSKDKAEQNREVKLNHLESSSEFKKGFKESASTQQDMKVRRNLIDEYEFGNNMHEPFPDYKDESASKLYSQESSKYREEHKIPDGFEETEHNTWSSKLMTHDSVPNGHVGQLSLMNGRHEEGSRNVSKFEKNEFVKEEKVITKKHRVTSKKTSPMREESPTGRSRKEKSSALKLNSSAAIKNKHIVGEELQRSSSNDLSQKRSNDSSFSYNTLPSNMNRSKDSEKKFYYFGANGLDDTTITRTKNENKTKSNASRTKTTTPFCSTKLVKEANAIVNGYDETDTKLNRSKLSDSHFTTVSPTGSGNQDSGYSSRGAATPASRGKETPQPGERFVDIEVDGRKEHMMHHSKTTRHREERAFSEDFDERMETSESDELPLHWGANGSLESHASPPSNQWSSLEEDDEEDIVAAHVNTPQSLIREMGKKEISYENSQRTQDKAYSGQMWFERTNVDSDYRKGMSTSATAGEHAALRNDNHINNNWGTSATLSRLETNKNRINNDVTMRSATVDRRQRRSKSSTAEANQTDGRDVRILLNGRDITDSPKELAGRRSQSHHASSGNLKVGGGYPSETESQHSGKSKGSRKSSGSSPTSKRVNFKTRSKAKRSASSAANLSPVHREVLMRSGSPARPPSTTGSLNSSGSDASNRSVILHATTVADIPPPRSYRYRIYRDSSASPGRRSPKSKDDIQSSNKSVTRSFSLLSPWKPKKYKAKYEQRYDNERQSQHSLNGSAEKGVRRENEVSHNSSSEKLDSLSPLPSESTTNHTSKKTSKHVSRHNSMPKDTRFTGFFKKKNKEA